MTKEQIIIEDIERLLYKKPKCDLTPWYNGFNGDITKGKANQWVISGTFERVGINRVKVTELPVHYSLKKYVGVLNKLEERGIITSYKDKTDETFEFIVNLPSSSIKSSSSPFCTLFACTHLAGKLTSNVLPANCITLLLAIFNPLRSCM